MLTNENKIEEEFDEDREADSNNQKECVCTQDCPCSECVNSYQCGL